MEISQEELKQKINNGEKVIVDFYGVWCGPCKLVKPIFERIAKNKTGEVQMYTMDVDKNKELAIELGIRAIPTIKSFNSGNVVDTKVGMIHEVQLNELVNNLING